MSREKKKKKDGRVKKEKANRVDKKCRRSPHLLSVVWILLIKQDAGLKTHIAASQDTYSSAARPGRLRVVGYF
jgi:hypothetical protein